MAAAMPLMTFATNGVGQAFPAAPITLEPRQGTQEAQRTPLDDDDVLPSTCS